MMNAVAPDQFHTAAGYPKPSRPLVDAAATGGERAYAAFTHLTMLAFPWLPVPVIGALVMWLIRRRDTPFLDDHGKEAVNFQITLVIYHLASLVLWFCGVGFILHFVLHALGVVGAVLAALAANRGEFYRYPACLRLLK